MKNIGSRIEKKNQLQKEKRERVEYRLAIITTILSVLAFIKSWF